jgi:hypothetical protein
MHMNKFWFTIAAACILTTMRVASAQDPNPIELAADALGAGGLTSIQFTAHSESQTYQATLNYETMSSRLDLVHDGLTEFVSGSYAWNVFWSIDPNSPKTEPLPSAVAERTLQIWLTPHGFLKAAITHTATTKRLPQGTEVSMTVRGRHKLTGLINTQHQVERVQARLRNPALGDQVFEANYADYLKVDGILFPMRITRRRDGDASLELRVDSVKPNAPALIVVPEIVRQSARQEAAAEGFAGR